MITTPTTFVIGAGAGCPYGLPASDGLHRAARELASNDDLYQMLLAITEIGAVDLNSVLEDLRTHPAGSIDAFLESRQSSDVTMRIGRHLIALLMASAIKNVGDVTKHSGDHDWLGYIIDRMRRGAPTSRDFANGNSGVRFVTFNFGN